MIVLVIMVLQLTTGALHVQSEVQYLENMNGCQPHIQQVVMDLADTDQFISIQGSCVLLPERVV